MEDASAILSGTMYDDDNNRNSIQFNSILTVISLVRLQHLSPKYNEI